MTENKNYFTIDEVSKITGVKKHTLRYWEKRFELIKPIRLSSRHRRYTKLDIENINKIKKMISEGFSIEGIKKATRVKNIKLDDLTSSKYRVLLEEINREIKDLLKIL